MMEAYSDFAAVYDTFMDETPYEEWCSFLLFLLKKHEERNLFPMETCAEITDSETGENENGEIKSDLMENLRQERNTILDLGCGTGTMTELLAGEGYDMIGVDSSAEMLRIAMEKRQQSGLDILYLCQDMRELELYGTVGAVISVCDCINYLLEEEDILQTFLLVNNYLYPGGLFIFDFNTDYKYREIIGDRTIAENREECSFIWENYYYEDEKINEYDVTVFVKENDEEEIFRRFQETHYQKGYEFEQMKRLVERAGLVFVEAVDADTHEKVTKESQRIYIVARKGKETGNERLSD